MALTLRLHCRKHIRYNPEDGEQAIRGGCAQCRALLEIYRMGIQFIRMAGEEPIQTDA